MAEAKHTRIAGLVLVLAAFTIAASPTFARYGGGTGRRDDPYLICTAEQMNAIGAEPNDWGKHFKLMADVNLSVCGASFNIIGTDPNHPFTGVFDGNGHTISNLARYLDRVDNVGLFGYVDDPNSIIMNLGLIHVSIDAGPGYHTGSMVGYLVEGTLASCFTEDGRVAGGISVGGLVGCNRGTIVNSYAACAVVGKQCVGGLAGTNGPCGRGVDTPCNPGVISGCYSVGAVTAEDYVGGLVGFPASGGVRSSFWNVETSGQADSAGGEGKTNAQMQDPNTFRTAGWDFFGTGDGPSEIWTVDPNTGYPILWWQVPEAQWPVLSRFAGGTGTAQDPYLISTAEHLNSIGHNPRLMKSHYRLMDDIDLKGIHFFSIGNEATPFTGVFDGGDKAISNFTLVCEAGYASGVFGYVQGRSAWIGNLMVANPHVDVNAGEFTGALVGNLYQGTVTNCAVEGGTVVGENAAGGLVGNSTSGHVANCRSTATVTARWAAGGLVGSDHEGQIKDSYSAANVNAYNAFAGGLVGLCWGNTIANCHTTGAVTARLATGGLVGSNDGTLVECYSTGSASGDSGAGGLVGDNGGVITACYATGSISGDESIGGLAGGNSGTIQDCYATGTSQGNTVVGGFAGSNDGSIASCYSTGTVHGTSWEVGGFLGLNSGSVMSCYSAGNVNGDRYVGGLAGWNWPEGVIVNCYARGNVTGTHETGGLVGRNTHVIKNCYAVGRVDSLMILHVGGLVGYLDEESVEASFWDVERSNRLTSEGGIGKTTAEMRQASVFLAAGWDFVGEAENGTEDIWWILEGEDYPRLSWEKDSP